MATPNSIHSTGADSVWTEHLALSQVRVRYQSDRDLFSPEEWRRLSFLRWLYRTGRVRS